MTTQVDDQTGRVFGKAFVFDVRTDPRIAYMPSGDPIPMRRLGVRVDGVDVTISAFAVNQLKGYVDCYVVEPGTAGRIRKFKIDPNTRKPVTERKYGIIEVFVRDA